MNSVLEICLQERFRTVPFLPESPWNLRISAGTLVQKITKLSKESNFVLTTITTDWRDLASCRDSEPTLFFPVGTTGPAVGQIDAAIAICSTCIVQEDCLQYALETNQESGVWGGYAEEDRRRLRKRWLAERRRRAV
ncbi:MAG: WhiB family transcriptional regulator [Acidobacteria bacterium]|nr:MAG: WhiB family transcriptional regulator [Acidobacteriota bacterium]TDI53357.1 MAG: WhiB family transcriptional regulator [Acidobacteriota bacterium]